MIPLDIKVVALDIYGTVLASDDNDNSFPPRKGLEDFLDKCKKRGIKVVTSSDAYIPDVKAVLESCFNNFPERGLSLERFNEFFRLDELPVKDFSRIVGHYDITPRELLVIGDSYKDVGGALKYGCCFLRCPEYRVDGKREFDFAKVEI